MKKIGLFWALLGIACADVDDSYMSIEGVEGDPNAGEPLFLSYCASCHGADGQGARAPSLLEGEAMEMNTEENVAEIQWRMRRQGLGGVLTQQDVADLVAYLYLLQGKL